MFGYVRIHRPALSDADYELYRGVYCSLCGALGRRYGPAARLTLRYDMTFLALLALSRAPESPEFQEGRCAYQPWKRCRRCTFPISARGALERAADIAMCMVCHKWRDSLSDERWYRKLWLALAAPLFLLWHKKAKRLAPEADRQVKIAMAAQRLVEAGEAPGLDACAHPSAHALGTLCAMAAEERELHSRLYRLGYLLGRWVYLIDAAADYEKDIRQKRFNPFRELPADEWKQRAGESLKLTAERLLAVWESLPAPRFYGILDNILLLGLRESEERVFGNAPGKEAKRHAKSI